MRLKCEFCNTCSLYQECNGRCACGHAECWHYRVRQFESLRENAHTPRYNLRNRRNRRNPRYRERAHIPTYENVYFAVSIDKLPV